MIWNFVTSTFKASSTLSSFRSRFAAMVAASEKGFVISATESCSWYAFSAETTGSGS